MRTAWILALVASVAHGQGLKSEQDKTLYALGLSMGRSLEIFNLSPSELDLVKKGLTDSITGAKAQVSLDEYGPKLQQLAEERRKAAGEKNTRAGQEFLAKAAAEKGAIKLPSGVIYKELKAGSGKSPAATDTVKVLYRGTLINGTEFDSSYKRNEPTSFPLNGVIKCWTEGVQKMKVGGKARLVCPSDTAYGERGAGPNIPPNATLVFEVELLSVGTDAPKK